MKELTVAATVENIQTVTDFVNGQLEALEKQIPALLQEIYDAHQDVLKSVPRYLGVQELAASAVTLRFVAEVGESDIYSGARLLNHDLFLGFRKLGVECPFQQVDVHSK